MRLFFLLGCRFFFVGALSPAFGRQCRRHPTPARARLHRPCRNLNTGFFFYRTVPGTAEEEEEEKQNKNSKERRSKKKSVEVRLL